MKLFSIYEDKDRNFIVVKIFGIKISIKSKRLLLYKQSLEINNIYEHIGKIWRRLEISHKEIYNIKLETISGIKKYLLKNNLPTYDICFLNIIHSKEFDNLYKYFEGYSVKIVETPNILSLFDNFTLEDLVTTLSSKIVISTLHNDIASNHLFEHQISINLWHACGAFKRIGFDAKNDTGLNSFWNDYFITSGEIASKCYAQTLRTDINKFKALGVCRTDNLFDKNYINEVKNKFYNDNPNLKYKKIFLYCPTFRETEDFQYVFKCNFDLNKLSQLLGNDEVFIYKLHPLVIQSQITNMHNVNENIIDFSSYNILDLIIIADVILTDYSSAFMEGMLLNKPLVFQANDIDEYERGFFIDYRKDLPGIIVESEDPQILVNALRNASVNHPNYEKFKKLHLGACDGNSSKRIADFIKSLLNNET